MALREMPKLLLRKQVLVLLDRPRRVLASGFYVTKLWRMPLILVAVMLSLVSEPAHSAQIQSLDEIRTMVASFLESQAPTVQGSVQVEVGALDERLQLPQCLSGLKAFSAPGTRPIGKVSVGVRCEAPVAWSVYVPARVVVRNSVLIINRALSRGAILVPEDVELVEQDVTSFADSYITDPSFAVGKILRRPLAAGTVLQPSYLQEPRIVKRGDRITLVVRTPGMEVRMEGEALEEGGRGDRIRARNLKSKREVQGTVVAPGTVEIQL